MYIKYIHEGALLAWPFRHVRRPSHDTSRINWRCLSSCNRYCYVAKMQKMQRTVASKWPSLANAETPDISLQCSNDSNFYKFAIACMTDVFSNQGVLDYTYVSGNSYGVSMYDWARGKYKFRPLQFILGILWDASPLF